MATFHCAVKYGNTGAAGLHAAYILREGPYFYGEKREELVYKESGNLPSWAKDNPLLFWNMADKHERANGRAYYEFEIALPSELTYEQNIALVHELIENMLDQTRLILLPFMIKTQRLSQGIEMCMRILCFVSVPLTELSVHRKSFFRSIFLTILTVAVLKG